MKFPLIAVGLFWACGVGALGCSGARTSPAEAPEREDGTPVESPAGVDEASEDAAEVAAAAEPTHDALTDEPSEGSAAPQNRVAKIAAVVQSHRQSVRDCYEAGLAKLPGLKGTMTIHFELDPQGTVSSAELNADRSDITAPQIVDCAIEALKGMPFPAHPEGMVSEVNYPFDFNP